MQTKYHYTHNKDTIYDKSTSQYKLCSAMHDSMRRDKDTMNVPLAVTLLEFFPDGWMSTAILIKGKQSCIYIRHKSDPTNNFYYVHKNYLELGAKLKIEQPQEYCTMLNDVISQQPSFKRETKTGLEIVITKDYFDYFYYDGFSVKDYILFMATIFYKVGGAMDLYQHHRNHMDVDFVLLKQSNPKEFIAAIDIAPLMANYYTKYLTILKRFYPEKEAETIPEKVEEYVQPQIPSFSEDIKKSSEINLVDRIPGIYQNGRFINNNPCQECARLQIFDEIELFFDHKEKQGNCYQKGTYEIVSFDYNRAIQLYLTVVGHKYHDKSISTQKIPFLMYRSVRFYEEGVEKLKFPDGSEKQTAYRRETYKNLLSEGQGMRDLYLEMFAAIDRYYSTSLVRQYLKKEGKMSGMSLVKFSADFLTDPDSLMHLCPMIRIYKNKIFWWSIKHVVSDHQLLNILWSSTDSGFLYERISNGKLLAYRIMDYDMKMIEDKFMCPLTGKLLLDPIVSKSGRTYDRVSLMEYVRINNVDPETGEETYLSDLRNNDTLKEAVTLMYLGLKKMEKSIIGDD